MSLTRCLALLDPLDATAERERENPNPKPAASEMHLKFGTPEMMTMRRQSSCALLVALDPPIRSMIPGGLRFRVRFAASYLLYVCSLQVITGAGFVNNETAKSVGS